MHKRDGNLANTWGKVPKPKHSARSTIDIQRFGEIKANEQIKHVCSYFSRDTISAAVHRLNVLGNECGPSSPQLGMFLGESVASFDEWMTKFIDCIDVFGSTWNDQEKINRLKLYLGNNTRTLFDSLTATEKSSFQNTVGNIRIKLNSPYLRELAHIKLSNCYQKDGESVNEFIKRLVPLVNAVTDRVAAEVREEMLCRNLMDKVRPDFRQFLEIVGPLIGRKDFAKLSAYLQEFEIKAQC